ncbi:hypothetical protein [Gordonia insulae]|uniref:Uncharacterized protein n=1 Tax=Gordonia insulae TaxID=2420509 RepID=A0A3G8JN74_9ACTN|nr:hypothetical protein [Gordonia insulae]AZG46433.1 hypothetical protein D7316_03034 [Gordonia insulae]
MNVPQPSATTRVAGFVIAMVAVFGIAFGVGRAVGPIDGDTPTHDPGVHQYME